MNAIVSGALCALLATALPIDVAVVVTLVCASAAVSLAGFPRCRMAGTFLLVVCGASLIGIHAGSVLRLRQSGVPGVRPDIVVAIVGRVSILRQGDADWTAVLDATEVSSDFLTVSSRVRVTVRGSGAGPAEGSFVRVCVSGLSKGSRSWYGTAVSVTTLRISVINRLRDDIRERMLAGIADAAGPSTGLVAALVLGIRSFLPVRTEELFRRAGISHVLALSGMHLAIVAGLAVLATRRLLGVRIALCVGAVVCLAFTLLIGPRPSLVRATIMCELALLFRLSGRRILLMELLAFTFIIHLMVQPTAFAEPSFQLSYAALLGISTVSAPLLRALRQWIPAALAGPLVAGIGAQTAGVPVLLSLFGEFHPVGIIAGALCAPAVTALMVLGLIASAFGTCAWIRTALSIPVNIVATVIDRLAWWFSAAPGIGHVPAWPAAILSCMLILLSAIREQRRCYWTTPSSTTLPQDSRISSGTKVSPRRNAGVRISWSPPEPASKSSGHSI